MASKSLFNLGPEDLGCGVLCGVLSLGPAYEAVALFLEDLVTGQSGQLSPATGRGHPQGLWPLWPGLDLGRGLQG